MDYSGASSIGIAGGPMGVDISNMSEMSRTATFETRIQSGSRISIPDAEREALDISESDIVQAVVFTVKRTED
ncbi:hypothetical protein BRD17_06855 [Halobacteriales archaeon SW_7_68_16]|nr:MAG: hypothetical protein BRD17_06855 [Halobacteriales archaeon SW_7_68_16]